MKLKAMLGRRQSVGVFCFINQLTLILIKEFFVNKYHSFRSWSSI